MDTVDEIAVVPEEDISSFSFCNQNVQVNRWPFLVPLIPAFLRSTSWDVILILPAACKFTEIVTVVFFLTILHDVVSEIWGVI